MTRVALDIGGASEGKAGSRSRQRGQSQSAGALNQRRIHQITRRCCLKHIAIMGPSPGPRSSRNDQHTRISREQVCVCPPSLHATSIAPSSPTPRGIRDLRRVRNYLHDASPCIDDQAGRIALWLNPLHNLTSRRSNSQPRQSHGMSEPRALPQRSAMYTRQYCCPRIGCPQDDRRRFHSDSPRQTPQKPSPRARRCFLTPLFLSLSASTLAASRGHPKTKDQAASAESHPSYQRV
ncbi:uncharacterized protein BJ171DRAFT_84709 [Polychytrium aggregatum]|uniref:uncharacterized protein n=1 Tax=Polychytrium aggregatum TaxID=110093 RepID=UPI0022FE8559|nr:uncharacterized protein BJ171DRAFT_84709 [Polychytrium aggregatum]KAI9205204.1 hypothetical protein BJ171DRAFT_84709 [Polychytrium aggregatum]